MDDLMVVGYDLTTGQPVHVQDQPTEEWRRKGYGRDCDLICWHCWLGHEAPKGTRVPLVTKGKIDGQVRTHFAHPAGHAPAGGHSPESQFHATSKVNLARWALGQPGVARVAVEGSTEDRLRRADVMVEFATGKRVAIEIQISDLTDAAWLERHADYQAADIVDVWIWRTGMRAGVARDAGLPVWLLDRDGQSIWTPVANPHDRRWGWWNKPHRGTHSAHWPACVGDETRSRRLKIQDCALTPQGIQPPKSFLLRLDDDWRKTQARASEQRQAAAQQALKRQTSEAAGTSSASRPRSADRPVKSIRPKSSNKPKCVECGWPLDESLVKYGRHYLC